MNRTKIEWCDYTWNPIKGLCPIGCWYCYGRAMYKRFKWDERIRFNGIKAGSEILMLNWNTPAIIRKPSRIFVCSTFEIFHPIVLREWRDEIFRRINLFPQHTFIILTKMPENIDRPMPDNVWLGTTVTGFDDYLRKVHLGKHKAKIRFISYEPILEPLPPVFPVGLDWLVMGRLTGHGNKKDPDLNTLKNIVDGCRELHVPLFMKNNLAEIWGKPLIQEYPK